MWCLREQRQGNVRSYRIYVFPRQQLMLVWLPEDDDAQGHGVFPPICRPCYIMYVCYTEDDLRPAATEPVCLASSTPGTDPRAASCACLPV